MAAKRLRGWTLEKETGQGASSSSKTPPVKSQSALADKLLFLWSTGALSAVMIRELAHLAILDGAQHPDLYALSKAGHFGQALGNVHRDHMVEFAPNIRIQEHEVVVQCIDPKTSKKEETTATMFLPHVMFSNLAKGYSSKFDSLMALKGVEEFWSGAEKTMDDRLRNHPMTFERIGKPRQFQFLYMVMVLSIRVEIP